MFHNDFRTLLKRKAVVRIKAQSLIFCEKLWISEFPDVVVKSASPNKQRISSDFQDCSLGKIG